MLTVGYQGLSLLELGAVLRSAGTGALIDVRDVPWSKLPEFRKGSLIELCDFLGIPYVHLKAAGNPKRLREQASARSELDRFRDHLASRPDLRRTIISDVGGFLGQGVAPCLLCLERDYRRCHRSVVVEILGQQWPNLRVTHLLPEAVQSSDSSSTGVS